MKRKTGTPKIDDSEEWEPTIDSIGTIQQLTETRTRKKLPVKEPIGFKLIPSKKKPPAST